MNVKILAAAVVPAVILTSCGTAPEPPKKHLSFATAQTGSVSLSEGGVATVRGSNVAELSFKSPGRIVAILANVGDRVEKGQLLATVDNREASIAAAGYAGSASDLAEVESAVRAIGTSVEALAESRAQVAASDVRAAEIGKSLAEKDLELARKNLENSRAVLSGSTLSAQERVNQAQQALSLAESQLGNTRSLLDQQESSLRGQALASLAGAFVTARSGRDFADAILGISDANRYKNDAFEAYLGAKNASTLSRADNAYRTFDAKYSKTYDWYYANVSGKSDVALSVAKEALERAEATLVLEREALHALKSVLENTVESSSLDATGIAKYKQETDAILANLESSMLTSAGGGITGSSKAIATFEKDRELRLSSLSDAVALAKTALELAKSGKSVAAGDEKRNLDALEIAVRVKEDAVKVADESYAKAVAAADMAQREMNAKVRETDAQAAEARAKKREADTGLALSSEREGYSEIRAPFSGTVTEKYLDAGSSVGPGTPVLQISDDRDPKATFSFDSSKAALEGGAEIPLESVKTGLAFTGKILVAGSADSFANGKRRAEVSVPKGSATVGDRVRLKVPGASVSGVLVPESAIMTRYLVPSVFVVENGVAKSKTVKVVARGNAMVVVEGIVAGSKVVTEGKDRLTEGEAVE